MQGKNCDTEDFGVQMSQSESSVDRCTPPTSLGQPDSVSVDSNPMPTIYRCRAPIASLDCMDELSGNSVQMLDQDAGKGTVSRNMSTHMGARNNSVPSKTTPGLRYRNLGKSGLRVPNFGLAIRSLIKEESMEEIVMTALENGINLFDLSEAHCDEAEEELGKIFKKQNVKRTNIIITMKIYWRSHTKERGVSRKHVIESVKATLARLQIEYVDVVLLHKVDPVCPMEELVRAMNFVINQGWAMYWGTARWSPSEIMDAYNNCRQFNCITPIVEQTEYHMFCREKTELYMSELYHKIGVGLIVWSASTIGKGIGRDDITGVFAKSRFNKKLRTFTWSEDDLAKIQAPVSTSKDEDQKTGGEPKTYGDKLRDLSNLAKTMNCSLSQFAMAWSLKNDYVHCLLLGATNIQQLKEHVHTLQIVPQLTPSLMKEIERIIANKPEYPPMVSTLAMRSQQNNIASVDVPGGEVSDTGTPKPEGDITAEAEPSNSESNKEPDRAFCLLQ